jgi:hypothetical protein
MQNGGLPEAGDAVMTFPSQHLASPEAYRDAASIVDTSGAPSADLARRRRDLALRGFRILKDGEPGALQEFRRRAAALVAPYLDRWRTNVQTGPVAQAQSTPSPRGGSTI